MHIQVNKTFIHCLVLSIWCTFLYDHTCATELEPGNGFNSSLKNDTKDLLEQSLLLQQRRDLFLSEIFTRHGLGNKMTLEEFREFVEYISAVLQRGGCNNSKLNRSDYDNSHGNDLESEGHNHNSISHNKESNLESEKNLSAALKLNNTRTVNSDLTNNSRHGNQSQNNYTFEDHSVDQHSGHNHEYKRVTESNHLHANGIEIHKCLTPEEILQIFDFKEPEISFADFINICPAIIYQMDSGYCRGVADGSHDHDKVTSTQSQEIIAGKVWGFSVLTVLVISLISVLGIAIIPFMQKVFYNHLQQFLVALAVGALSGDALLHLLPHALSEGHDNSHRGDHDNEGSGGQEEHAHSSDGVFKGLCALAGIFIFFLLERILTILTDVRRKRKRKSKPKFSVHCSKHSDCIGEKLSQNDCDDAVMEIHGKCEFSIMYYQQCQCVYSVSNDITFAVCEGEGSALFYSRWIRRDAVKGYAADTHQEVCMKSLDNSREVTHKHCSSSSHEEEEHSMLNNSHHGHSHDIDGAPKSVSSFAWMIILGDGFHNFSDGLAIGAAYANSITGGFSTSVAVLCHELPHELGDFAVLLRAGMSAKQALFYNIMGAVPSFLGMLIGVLIGNVNSASMWIFAAIGGMFLYIALMDMLPEMTNMGTKKGENPFYHLAIQLTGMFLGSGAMFLIAIYEQQIMHVLG